MKQTKLAGYYVKKDVLERLDNFVEKNYMTKSGVVTLALEEYLRKHMEGGGK